LGPFHVLGHGNGSRGRVGLKDGGAIPTSHGMVLVRATVTVPGDGGRRMLTGLTDAQFVAIVGLLQAIILALITAKAHATDRQVRRNKRHISGLEERE
jgi:hypothetical protein